MSRPGPWSREYATPFHLIQQEFRRLLDPYLTSVRDREAGPIPNDLDPNAWSPPVDVHESADEFLVAVEVPGVDPASIDVAAVGSVLTIKGVKEPGDQSEARIQVRERLFGVFQRQVGLPSEVDFDRAEATINNGVLRIRLPKRTAARTRTIPVRPA